MVGEQKLQPEDEASGRRRSVRTVEIHYSRKFLPWLALFTSPNHLIYENISLTHPSALC